MINLMKFAVNHFDNVKISDDNMKKFAEIAMQRFIANNPGSIYDTIIAEITAAYTDYYGAITDEDVKTAIKEGSTVAMNGELKTFKASVSQKEGIVRGNYGVDSPTYQEFFPHGVTEYSNATLGNAQTLYDRMKTAATAHQADLGLPFVTLFTTLRANFVAKRDAQLLLIGEVKGKKDTTSKNRNVLEVVLMKSVLTVALNNIGNPDAIDVYFDQSFLKPPAQKTFSGKIGPGKLVNVDTRKYKSEQEITLYSDGDTGLSFSLSETKDAAGLKQIKLEPHEERKVNASELGDVNICKFLIVTNTDGALTGSYKVVVEL
jgi:hypothetical protein